MCVSERERVYVRACVCVFERECGSTAALLIYGLWCQCHGRETTTSCCISTKACVCLSVSPHSGCICVVPPTIVHQWEKMNMMRSTSHTHARTHARTYTLSLSHITNTHASTHSLSHARTHTHTPLQQLKLYFINKMNKLSKTASSANAAQMIWTSNLTLIKSQFSLTNKNGFHFRIIFPKCLFLCIYF